MKADIMLQMRNKIGDFLKPGTEWTQILTKQFDTQIDAEKTLKQK